MKGALLRENEFLEDVKKIEFFCDEEKKLMDEILISFEETASLYKSHHKSKIVSINKDLDFAFQTVEKNRQAYVRNLRNVIVRYTELLDVTEKIMEGDNNG